MTSQYNRQTVINNRSNKRSKRARLMGRFLMTMAAFVFTGATGLQVQAQAQDTVFRYDSAGTLKAQSTTLNNALTGYSSGDVVKITADVTSTGLSLGSTDSVRKTITISSDIPGTVRTVNLNNNRFLDYAFGDFYFTDVTFTKGSGNNGGIFCRWTGNADTHYSRIIGDNATFTNCVSPGPHAGVMICQPGLFLEGTFTFSNNTAATSGGALTSVAAYNGGIGGSIVFSKDNSVMSFSGNTAGGKPNDVYTDNFVTIQDAGQYTFGGGIDTKTLNISDASVTFGSGSISKATTLNLDGANITIALNNNNIVSGDTTAYTDGATQFTVANPVAVNRFTPIVFDLSGVTNAVDSSQSLLAGVGDFSAVKNAVQTTGSTTAFAYVKSSTATGLKLGIETIEPGKTLYRYDGSGTLKGSGTDFNTIGWEGGNTYILTGDATISNQFNSYGATLTIQSATEDVHTITATGDNAGRKRVFDWGYGTYNLSNVEFSNIGLSNDMGCFAQYGRVSDGYIVKLVGNNVTFNAMKGNYASVVNGSSGVELTGTFTFKDCTTTQSAVGAGVVFHSAGADNIGGYVRFYGDGSSATFENNRSSDANSRGDINANYSVTFEDNGTYRLDGGIRTATLNIAKGADVTLASGAVTSVSTLNIDTDSSLTITLNDNNFVSAGSTTFTAGATQTNIGTTVITGSATGSGFSPITIDLSGITNFDLGTTLLAMTGNATNISPFINSTAGSDYLVSKKGASTSGLWVALQKIEPGKTLYRYDGSGALKGSGTDFNTIGWESGNTYILTGDATISNQFNSYGATLTIQSATDDVHTITATGDNAGRKRVFDWGYGTYNLSNVEFSNIGLSNDLGCFAQYNVVANGNIVKIVGNNVTFNAMKGTYASVVNGPSGIELTGTFTFKDCTTTQSAVGAGVVLHSAGSNNIGGYVRFYGDGSSAKFENNRSSDTNSRGDINTNYFVTFEDKGTYWLDGGIRTARLNVLDGADVTLATGSISSLSDSLSVQNGSTYTTSGNLTAPSVNITGGSSVVFGSGSTSTITNLTRDASSWFAVGVNDSNIVDTGVRTTGTGGTAVNITNLSVPTTATMTTFQIDPSAVTAVPATGKEILVLKNDMTPYTADGGKIIVQTSDNDKYLAYLTTADSTGLAVSLTAKTGTNNVYCRLADGTWSNHVFVNNAQATDGTTIVLTGDVSSNDQMSNNAAKTLTLQSSTSEMRRINGSTATRFLDYGYGTFYFSNVEFYDFGTLQNNIGQGVHDMGSVFQNGTNNMIHLYSDNVLVTNNSGMYAALMNAAGGADLCGTMTVSGSRTTTTSAGVVIHTGNTIRFYGDDSNMTFTDNAWTNGTPNDVMAGTILFEDAGMYRFDGGLVASTAISLSDSVSLTLGSNSHSSSPVLNLADTSTLTVEPGAGTGANTVFAMVNVTGAPTVNSNLTVGISSDNGNPVFSELIIGTETMPAVLSITGNYEQNVDVFLDVFETSETGLYTDSLEIKGTATFADDAELIIRNQGWETSGLSDEINWFLADSKDTLVSIADALNMTDLGSTLTWTHEYVQLDSGQWSLRSTGAEMSSVPEPATWLLLVLGTAGLWIYRRRK